MFNIELYKKKFYTLMESEIGNVKPILSESSRPDRKGVDKKLFLGTEKYRQEELNKNLSKVLETFTKDQTLSIEVPKNLQSGVKLSNYSYCALESEVVIVPPQILTTVPSKLFIIGYGYLLKNPEIFIYDKAWKLDQAYLKSLCGSDKSFIGDFIWTPHSPSKLYHGVSSKIEGSRINPNSEMGKILK